MNSLTCKLNLTFSINKYCMNTKSPKLCRAAFNNHSLVVQRWQAARITCSQYVFELVIWHLDFQSGFACSFTDSGWPPLQQHQIITEMKRLWWKTQADTITGTKVDFTYSTMSNLNVKLLLFVWKFSSFFPFSSFSVRINNLLLETCFILRQEAW